MAPSSCIVKKAVPNFNTQLKLNFSSIINILYYHLCLHLYHHMGRPPEAATVGEKGDVSAVTGATATAKLLVVVGNDPGASNPNSE